jgi:uncharacterized protein
VPSAIYREVAEGLILSIRVTPKSSKNEIVGLHETAAITVKVSAPPDKGKANRAVVEVLAKALRVPKSSLAIVSGETSRNKNILVKGKADELRTAVQHLVQDLQS